MREEEAVSSHSTVKPENIDAKPSAQRVSNAAKCVSVGAAKQRHLKLEQCLYMDLFGEHS